MCAGLGAVSRTDRLPIRDVLRRIEGGYWGELHIGRPNVYRKELSSSPAGPFADAGEFACPGNGKWAIDPDVFIDQTGIPWVVYRDDNAADAGGSAISIVRVDGNGSAIWSSRKTLLKSSQVAWEHIRSAGYIIENPSMGYVSGSYYLFYSGNDWNSARYATGILKCSYSGWTCGHFGSSTRPYFGYVGSAGISPLYGLPYNAAGPGGMSIFKASNGAPLVTWHFIISYGPPVKRVAIIGTLRRSTSGVLSVV